jgi:ssDNA-binding replication factor A large subunit
MSNIEKGSLYRISNGLIKYSNDLNKRIVVDVEDVCEQTFKDSNNKLAIRRIYIADHTNSRIAVSFWGDQAIDFQMDIGSVIVLNGVKLTNYNGLSLSVIKVTYVYDKTYAQNSPRIQILKDYWQEKSDSDIKNYNNITTDYSNTNYSKKRRLN